MKILVLADEECPAFYDYYVPGRLAEYDLIISCGDLNAKYLTFIVTMARAPVLYVHGNHDTGYSQVPPEGCDCLEDQIINFKGVRILGLGGCKEYRPSPCQFTEREMKKRIRKLRRKLRRSGGVDIVVTHAPPAGVGDGDDPAHKGFEAFLELLDQYKPKYLFHGHVHTNYSTDTERVRHYGQTTVINACQRYVLEVPDEELGYDKTARYI